MWISPEISWVVLETQLLEAMKKVAWIGELPIGPTDFDNLAAITRRGFTSEGKQLIDKVKPAIFVTSMVFAARYSHENARNFWTPYALQVWGLKEANQHFQKRSREHFHECAQYLRKQFGFSFPRMHSGDVVRPVYRHAVIPFYLEKDFADWLKSKRAEIADMGEAAVHVLCTDPGVNYLPPTLRVFLQSEETSETAHALIQDMVTAADLYLNEGEPAENIRALIDYSPIRLALWDQLQDALDEHEPRRIHRSMGRPFSTQIEWIWSFTHEDLVLRLRNLRVESEVKPSRLVWVEDKDPLRANLFDYVYPYSQGQGRWLVDEVILSPDEEETPRLRGNLVLIGEDQSTQESLSVPALKTTPLMFFRLTQQRAYGIEVDYNSKPITDGDWALSMAVNVTLLDEEDREILPLEKLPVPLILAKHARHTRAGIYDLRLPVTVRIGDESFVLEQQTHGVSSPILEGGSLVPGLSPYVSPAFSDRSIRLKLSGGSRRLIELGRLLMKTKSAPTRSWSLRQLEDDGWLSLEGDILNVDLRNLLPDGPAVVVLEVYQGLYPALPSPLQITLLSGIQIVPPDPNTVFSPNLLPSGRIRGVALEQIAGDPCLDIQSDGDGLRIVWRDLRLPCTLRLMLGDEPVAMAWDANRVCAWLEPKKHGGVLTLEDIQAATLNLLAPRDYRQGWLWIEGETAKRQVDLGARGHYCKPMREDQLYEMIRKHPSPLVTVWTELAGQAFEVVEVQRTPEIRLPQVGYDMTAQALTFSCSIDFEWPGRFTFRVRPLAEPEAAATIVGRAESLRAQQALRCGLEPGLYLLEILHDGVPLLLDQAQMLVAVGEDWAGHLPASAGLLDYLTGDQVRVPGPRGAEFLREVAAQSEDEVLPGLRLYQLATLPGISYTALAAEKLRELWPPLTHLAFAQDATAWEASFGLLPAWAVLSESVRLVSPRYKKLAFAVFPEKTLLKGRRGIGYAYLNLNDNNTKTKVYVDWQPDPKTDVLLARLGLPEGRDSRHLSSINIDDMASIYYCAFCGGLIDYHRYVKELNGPGPLIDYHRHGRQSHVFVDTLNRDPAMLSLHSESSGRLCYAFAPEESVDHTFASRLLRDDLVVEPSHHPVALAAYQYATFRWVSLYRAEEDARILVDRVITHGGLQQTIAYLLQTMTLQPSTGYFAAAGRLLAVLAGREAGFPAAQIDRFVLALAVLLRGIAYRPAQTDELLRTADLEDEDLIRMLEVFWLCCPELLSWALTWAELFCQHAVS